MINRYGQGSLKNTLYWRQLARLTGTLSLLNMEIIVGIIFQSQRFDSKSQFERVPRIMFLEGGGNLHITIESYAD